MPKSTRLLYLSHLFPRLTLPDYGLDTFNAAIRIEANVLVITRKLPETLIQTPASVKIRQISYIDSHLQLSKNNIFIQIASFIQSFLGQLLLAIKVIIPARAFRPNIIHSFGALTLPAAYSARLLTGTPVVISLLGTDFHRINQSPFLTWWVSLADAIVCVSKHMVTDLQKKLPNKSIHYCPSGVDLSVFYYDNTVERRDEIVCVGRLTAVKRYDVILKTFAIVAQEYPKYSLTIMGRGELLIDLQEQARDLGIFKKVHFGGVVGKKELADILRSAKLFLMASDWEGTPKAMLEAMACGVPVVSTNVGDCAYLVRGAGKIIRDHSADSLAQAAMDILNSHEWEKYSVRAIENASQFDWQQVTNRLKEVYSTLNPGVLYD